MGELSNSPVKKNKIDEITAQIRCRFGCAFLFNKSCDGLWLGSSEVNIDKNIKNNQYFILPNDALPRSVVIDRPDVDHRQGDNFWWEWNAEHACDENMINTCF